MKRHLILLLLVLVSASCAMRQPEQMHPDQRILISPLEAAVRFYRGPLNHLTAVRHGQCPMAPSDSAYSIACFEKHGFLMGWIMTCDRLLRCGRDELHLSPAVVKNGRVKCHDPVDANDFWWTDDTDADARD